MRRNSAKTLAHKSFVTIALFLAAAIIFSPGCSDGGSAYVTRGVITALPATGDPFSQLIIQHEAIPEFVGQNGEVVGMETMKMPFPVDEAVDLSSYAIGDPVAFTFVVTWDGVDSGWVLTEIEKLPDGTALNLGEDSHGHDHAGHDHADHDHSGHDH